MIEGVESSGTDTDGKPFFRLADSTLQRKIRQGLSRKPLVATGAMTGLKTFYIHAGKRRGYMKHKPPAGTHTRYKTVPFRQKKGGGFRTAKYDHGLAHQYSTTPMLPRRQWWLEPGTAKWRLVQQMIPLLTREFLNSPSDDPASMVANALTGTGFK